MRESISIGQPSDMKAELDRYVEAEGVSRSDLVREGLREYLFGRKLRALRARLMPYAEARGFHTDEDVFREVS